MTFYCILLIVHRWIKVICNLCLGDLYINSHCSKFTSWYTTCSCYFIKVLAAGAESISWHFNKTSFVLMTRYIYKTLRLSETHVQGSSLQASIYFCSSPINILIWPLHTYTLRKSQLSLLITTKHCLGPASLLQTSRLFCSRALGQVWMLAAAVNPFDPLTHRTIQMWPTYDPFVTHMLKFSF